MDARNECLKAAPRRGAGSWYGNHMPDRAERR